ncbi:MAG TPA: glycosyltransferase family 4 protein [Candidatus Polarisedimenticolia bacterium]
MNILLTNFHRGWGGQPACVLMLAGGLAERGQQVTIAAPPGSMLAERARAAGLRTFESLAFRKTKYLGGALRDAFRLADHLRAARYDLINAQGSQDLWTAVAARRLSGQTLPLLFTRHNTKHIKPHAANRWLYRHQVDHLIAVSRSVIERYRPFLDAGSLTPERISVVHPAYRPDRFRTGLDGSGLRRELGVDSGTPIVGVIGRLVPDKGPDIFLRAAATVLAARPDARFVLTGTGTMEPELRRLIGELGIAAAVRLLGFRDNVPEITTALTISVLPAVDCDASSTVLKEALACGVPVIATDIGGAREIVLDGTTGLVVPPGDPGPLARAILDLLADPARARAMGSAGSRDVAARFTPERLAAGTLEVYEKVLAVFRSRSG